MSNGKIGKSSLHNMPVQNCDPATTSLEMLAFKKLSLGGALDFFYSVSTGYKIKSGRYQGGFENFLSPNIGVWVLGQNFK